MKTYQIDTPISEERYILGEGPLWHPLEQRLYWLDIDGCSLQVLDPKINAIQSYNLGQRCGAFAFRRQGDLLIAGEHTLAYWDERDSLSSPITRFYPDDAPQLMNDGKADSSGRFWVGSKGPFQGSSLFRIDENIESKEVLSKVTISNGLDWDLEEKYFYYTDSYAQTIYKYRYNPISGDISEPNIFFHIDDGTPDGLTMDSAGNLWVAVWDGWKVLYISPKAEVLAKIELPVQRPTSVTLGGATLTDLYITSAYVGLTEDDLKIQPYAGCLFKIPVETPGRPCNFFNG